MRIPEICKLFGGIWDLEYAAEMERELSLVLPGNDYDEIIKNAIEFCKEIIASQDSCDYIGTLHAVIANYVEELLEPYEEQKILELDVQVYTNYVASDTYVTIHVETESFGKMSYEQVEEFLDILSLINKLSGIISVKFVLDGEETDYRKVETRLLGIEEGNDE